MLSKAGGSGEGPPKKGETGLFALIVCKQRDLPAVDLVSSAGDSEPGHLCSVKQNLLSFAETNENANADTPEITQDF